MKHLMFTLALICAAIWTRPAEASWLGEAWLWVKIERVKPHQAGEALRGVDLLVLRCDRYINRSESFCKELPGQRFSVSLEMNSAAQAKALKAGARAPVKYRLSTYMTFDPKTGQRVGGSSSKWTYLNDEEGGGTFINRDEAPKEKKPRVKRRPQGTPSQAKPSQAEPSQAKPSQAKPSQAEPPQEKPKQSPPGAKPAGPAPHPAQSTVNPA
ncbi:hypothetical protein KKB55_10025 [Myxococcota bacterium]|nr:hypothetical protein [Myxococcota bacterium]MBU1898072.1 hypothetical protein [Myxococcota bacterium]